MGRRTRQARTDDRDTVNTFAADTARQSVARLGDVLARLSALSYRLPVSQNAGVAAELYTAAERLEALAGYLEHAAAAAGGPGADGQLAGASTEAAASS
jgi:hypothetical protein